MSTETRKYKYVVSLEWSGTVEVDLEPDDDEESLREAALDLAVDECLSSPAGYAIYDYTIEDVTA